MNKKQFHPVDHCLYSYSAAGGTLGGEYAGIIGARTTTGAAPASRSESPGGQYLSSHTWRLREARSAAWNHRLACASARPRPVQILITSFPADRVDEPSGTRANRGWGPACLFPIAPVATAHCQKILLSPPWNSYLFFRPRPTHPFSFHPINRDRLY